MDVELVDRNGSRWRCSGSKYDDDGCLFMFSDLDWQWNSTPSIGLDLHAIQEIRLNCHFPDLPVGRTFEVYGMQAVEFR